MNYKKISHTLLYNSSFHYIISTFFQQGIVFLTIPIFTRLLSLEEYGYLNIFQTLLNILIVFSSLGIRGTIVRYYHDKKIKFDAFMSSNLLFLIFYNFLFILTIFLIRNTISAFFKIPEKLVYLTAIAATFSTFLWFHLSYLQAKASSLKYASVSIISSFFINGTAIIFVLYLNDEKYYGKVYAQIFIGLVIFILVFRSLIIEFGTHYNFHSVLEALKFGIPLLPHMLSGFILAFFDRIIINQLVNTQATAIYSLAYNIGMIVHVVVMSLNKTWSPFFYKELNEARYEKINIKAKLHSNHVTFASFFLVLLSTELLKVLAPSSYSEGLILIPIIVLSYNFLFLYTLFSSYSFYRKKTYLISIGTIIAMIVSVSLNYALMPRFGYQIAAFITLFTYIILFGVHYLNAKYILKEVYTIPLNKILLNCFLVFVITGLVSSFHYYDLKFKYYAILRYILLIIVTYILYKRDVMNYLKSVI